ncbi:MAG: AraC-like DNA-binding protein [Reinekea sp.]|jgi:AraC-like DNA-binding protein
MHSKSIIAIELSEEIDMPFNDTAGHATKYAANIKNKSIRALPNLFVMRKDEISALEAVVYNPVICLILQGAKETTIGMQSVKLQVGDALLVSHDLPVVSKITMASPELPYLALILSLDLGVIRSLYKQVGEAVIEAPNARSLSAGPADLSWAEPLERYLALAGNPLEAQVLGPPILREVHFRLLMSPIGGMLRNLLSVDSHASRIGKAILKIRADFREPLAVADLAKTAGMSQSSFHEHFKSVTGTTPLQFQKDLRMIAARALLHGGQDTVASVGFEVGYESPTHFSRDYTRKFGVPPSKDKMRADVVHA